MFTGTQDFSVYWPKRFFPQKMSFILKQIPQTHDLQNKWDLF